MTFIIEAFQPHCKSEQNQVKWKKTTRDLFKSDYCFLIYKEVHCLNGFWDLFLDKAYLKNEW